MTWTRTRVLLPIAASLAVLAGCADDGELDSTALVAAQAGDAEATPAISSRGVGRATATPDLLTVTLGVESRAATAGEALTAANDRARLLLQQLQDAGVQERDVATVGLEVSPEFDREGRRVEGYRAANRVVAKLRDLDRAGEVIDAAARAVGDDVRIDGLQFSIEDTTDLLADARRGAVEAARRQAEQLADAAGVDLGPVRRVAEETTSYPPAFDARAVDGGGEAASSVPLQPGVQEVEVAVNVEFAIA